MDKPTPAALAAFDGAFPEGAERKKMFGMPAAFVGGNMCFGVFVDTVVLRVGEARSAELEGHEGFERFEPMPGRPWREYVAASAPRWGGTPELAAWAAETVRYAATLPPKR